ncbi:MAG: phosphate transporter permease PstA [Pseudomonadota bacterium]|jgi:phosphate transport system permease protein
MLNATDLRRKGVRLGERLFVALCLLAVVLPLALLLLLLGALIKDASARLGWSFLLAQPSRHPELAGILPAIAGSLQLVSWTALFTLPVGVGAAIYLEEYARRGRAAAWMELNIANLAGVPSLIYGLFGLGVFVRTLGLGRSILAGAATLSLVVLPVVILATREALRAVPQSLREASQALGATRWRMISCVLLPMAFPGMLTGSLLALSRAIGETAPLLVVGALSYVGFVPHGIAAPYTALPLQIFNWVSRPQHAFLVNAAAAIVVLLGFMLLMTGLATLLRHRLQRRWS